MTKTELNEECEKRGICKECKYRKWNVTIGYECFLEMKI